MSSIDWYQYVWTSISHGTCDRSGNFSGVLKKPNVLVGKYQLRIGSPLVSYSACLTLSEKRTYNFQSRTNYGFWVVHVCSCREQIFISIRNLIFFFIISYFELILNPSIDIMNENLKNKFHGIFALHAYINNRFPYTGVQSTANIFVAIFFKL